MKLRDLYKQLDSEGRNRLAEKAGVSRVYLWQLQRGVRKNPTSEVLTRLAAADRRLSVNSLVTEFNEAKQEVN